MSTLINQSPCGSVALPREGIRANTAADFEALARYGRCLRSAAMFAAARRLAGHLRRGVRAVLEIVREQLRQRRAIADLSRLDDHLLADIGVRREDIPRLVNELARRTRADSGGGTAKRSMRAVAVTRRKSAGDCAANDYDCRARAA